MPAFVELLSGSGHLTVRKWTLDCPKVDTCVNRGDSFSDGYVSGAIFVRKKLCFLQQK